MSKIFNLFQSLTYAGLALYGEYLQDVARESVENYNWMSGHLTDIAMVAQAVSFGQIIAGKNKIIQYVAALAPPIICTLHELGVVNLNPSALTYDPQDILCYWGGAALAFGLSKTTSNFFTKKLDSPLENKLGN